MMMATLLRPGFIGIGQIGLPLALNLAYSLANNLARFSGPVLMYDSDPGVVAKIADNTHVHEHVAVCSSIRELVQQSDIVFTCLPHEKAIRSVYLDAGGILECASSGLISCELSTVSPDLVRQIDERLQEKAVTYLQAPIFGTPEDAAKADVFFAVSGPENYLEHLQPFLDAMGRGYRYVGGPGVASLMKILQNSLGYGYAVLTAEVLTLCKRLEISPEQFVGVVKEAKAMGWSRYFESYAEAIVARKESGAGLLKIAAKDTQLLTEIIGHANVAAPVLQETAKQFEKALNKGWGNEEFTAVTRIIEENNSQ